MTEYKKAIETLYRTKEEFLVIGLTGRTGAGCSTVADILKKQVNELEFEYPQREEWKKEDEYKFNIIKDYIEQKGKWVPFEVVEVSCVILSYIFSEKNGQQTSKKGLLKYLEDEQANKEKVIFKIDNYEKLKKDINGLNSIFEEIKDYPLDVNNINEFDENKIEKYYQFYLKRMPEYKSTVKEILQNYSCYEIEKSKLKDQRQTKYHLYTYLLQKWGNNIRASGNPYSSTLNQEEYYSLAKRIELLIEIIKKHNENNKENGFDGKTRICIDAIRNVNESSYLKNKYRAYYLLSISVDEGIRKLRLKNLNANEQESIDNVEYAKKYEPEQFFYHQNIAQCFEMADIHLYNKEERNQKFFLTWQLVKYITLMIHPGLITPTHMERCMQLAFNAKYNSGCLSRQVGAVVTGPDFAVKSVGWNDVPKGHVPCNLRDVKVYSRGTEADAYSEFERDDKKFKNAMCSVNDTISQCNLQNQRFPYCFKDVYNGYTDAKNQVFTRALHAEENAFLNISKYGGQGVKDGFLFCTASPCELCSKKAYQLGIRNIYYIDPYPGIAEKHIIQVGKEQNRPKMNLFYGAIGEAYISLYRPLLPYKDELELLTGIDCKKVAKEGSRYGRSEPKTSDLLYHNVDLKLHFKTREEIESIREVDFSIENGTYTGLDRYITWTGSSYGGTELTECDYKIKEYRGEISPYRYFVDFGEEKTKGDRIKYTAHTTVRDERHIMQEYFAHYINYPTDKLRLEIKVSNKLIENVKFRIYADKEMVHLFEDKRNNDVLKINEKTDGNKAIYYIEIPYPNLFYTYSLEWNFKK